MLYRTDSFGNSQDGKKRELNKSRNGAAVAPSRKDGNLASDDGKPRDKVSDTVRNMAAGEPC